MDSTSCHFLHIAPFNFHLHSRKMTAVISLCLEMFNIITNTNCGNPIYRSVIPMLRWVEQIKTARFSVCSVLFLQKSYIHEGFFDMACNYTARVSASNQHTADNTYTFHLWLIKLRNRCLRLINQTLPTGSFLSDTSAQEQQI